MAIDATDIGKTGLYVLILTTNDETIYLHSNMEDLIDTKSRLKFDDDCFDTAFHPSQQSPTFTEGEYTADYLYPNASAVINYL